MCGWNPLVDTNPGWSRHRRHVQRIEEGSSYRIGKIFVAGNTRTQEKIVHRNSQLEEGMAYDRESILQAQQRLYATGLFNRVDIVTLEEATPGRTRPADPARGCRTPAA